MKTKKEIINKHFKINEDWIQKSNQNLVMDLLRKQFKTNKSK